MEKFDAIYYVICRWTMCGLQCSNLRKKTAEVYLIEDTHIENFHFGRNIGYGRKSYCAANDAHASL